MIRVNLFPFKEIKRKRDIKKIIVINLIFLVIILISTFLVYNINSNKIEELESNIKKEKQKLIKLASLRKKIKDFKKKQAILETRLKIINELNSYRLYPSYLFFLISKNIPDELWINYMNVKMNKISLKGIALDEPTIVKFINNLKKTKFFKNIYLNQVSLRIIQRIKLKEFSLDLYPDLSKYKEIL